MAMHITEGVFSYAVAQAADITFLPVEGFCTGYAHCVYSQAEDTMLMESSIASTGTGHARIKNFSKYLQLYGGEHRYYQFEHADTLNYLNNGEDAIRTGSVGISRSGRWAVMEARGYGFIRIDIRTGDTRRIVAASSPYGYGFNPTYELAISDSGQWVAITGQNSGLSILEVTQSCGDEITVDTPQYFNESTTPCLYVPFDQYAAFAGFYQGSVPRFSVSAASLSVYITTGSASFLAQISPVGDSEETQTTPTHWYRAFGDSFTSGEGELSDSFYFPTTNTTANTCHVSTRSYPYLLQDSWQIPTTNLACSGSRTHEVYRTIKAAANDSQVLHPSLISLSVGGNDVGLVAKLSACIQPGTCEWARPERRIATAHEIKALFQPLTTLIHDMKTEYTGAELFIVGYPKIVNDTQGASCGLVLSSLLSGEERVFMNRSIEYLNQVVRAAAFYSGTQFVDIGNVFEGQRLCDSSSVAMNGIRYGDDIAPLPFIKTKFIGAESFHPTPHGHTLIAQAIRGQLGDTSAHILGCGCAFDESLLSIPEYWTPGLYSEWASIRQLASTFITNTHLVDGGTIAFAFPAGTFMPEQTVALELHSDAASLGTFVAELDGSLVGEGVLPTDIAGQHTVHAVGQSPSETQLDMYQSVFITEPSAPPASELDTSNTDSVELPVSTAPNTESLKRGEHFTIEMTDEPLLASVAIPPTTPTPNQVASVLGIDAVHEGETRNERRDTSYVGALGTYAIIAAVSVLGLGCLYWYIRIKNREVD
jgi:hypothetical protein